VRRGAMFVCHLSWLEGWGASFGALSGRRGKTCGRPQDGHGRAEDTGGPEAVSTQTPRENAPC